MSVLFPQRPEMAPAVRDLAMNRTFQVISRHFQQFGASDWTAWFGARLTAVLPSFTTEMLTLTLARANCINYRVV